MTDHILRAMTRDGWVKAVAIRSTDLAERARQIHHTTPNATAALGRALSACSMLGNMQKIENGSLTLQIKGGGPIGTILCYAVICLMNCFFISKTQRFKPRYGRVFLRPLVSAAVMGAAAWAVYGLADKALHASAGGSRMLLIAEMGAAIIVAVVVYLVMVIATRAVTSADMKLIPKGEKLAKLLHIR